MKEDDNNSSTSNEPRKIVIENNNKNKDDLIKIDNNQPPTGFSTPATIPLKDMTEEDLTIPTKPIPKNEIENDPYLIKNIKIDTKDEILKSNEMNVKSAKTMTQLQRESMEFPDAQDVTIIQRSKTEPDKTPKQQTIFSGALVITNFCLGTTILTLAVRTKPVSLFWMLIICVICALADYWCLLRTCQAGDGLKATEYSQVIEYHFGKVHKQILNVSIVLFSYGFLLAYLALIYPIIGRFIMAIFYKDKYDSFEDFKSDVWSKAYIKWPVQLSICLILTPVCLQRDMAKLNFASYLGVGATSYTFIVVIIQCHSYYKHYKDTVYKPDDKDTHVNWFDLTKSFNSELDFFQAMATLFAAYACTTGIYPVYEGFKYQKNGLTKMKWAIFFGIAFTTLLHFLAITTSFLTDPITPEDLIIYRKPKGPGYDIFMSIAKIAVSISLFFTFPGYYFGYRVCVANIINKGVVSTRFNIITTILSVFICGIIAIVYDKILNYLNYIGGFISPIIVYIYPIAAYIKSRGKPYFKFSNILEIIGVIILFIIGWLAGIRTIISDIKGEK